MMISFDATESLSLTQLSKMAFQNSCVHLSITSWKYQDLQTLQEMYRLPYLFIDYEQKAPFNQPPIIWDRE